MNDWDKGLVAGLVLMAVAWIILLIVIDTDAYIYAQTCPTILEQAATPADSLAIFQKHEGCWDYVQEQTP